MSSTLSFVCSKSDFSFDNERMSEYLWLTLGTCNNDNELKRNFGVGKKGGEEGERESHSRGYV